MSILCAGLALCDLLLKPVDMTVLTQDTSTADNIQLAVGGDALNVAVGLAGLGSKPRLLSKVGNDDLGSYLLKKVQEADVDIQWIKQLEIPTSASGVLIRSDGERSFLSFKGACHDLNKNDFPEECFEGVDLFYIGSAFDLPGLDGEEMVHVMKMVQEHGIKTALDATGEPTEDYMEWFTPVLEHTDYFLPSLREACSLTGCANAEDAARRFADIGVGCVAVKLGDQGSMLLNNGTITKIPTYTSKVVDTTGAGDSFVAGFLRGLELGLSPIECTILGSAHGSMAVEHLGASGHYVSEEELKKRVQWIKAQI